MIALLLRLLVAASVLMVAACGSVPKRTPYTVADQEIAVVVGMPANIRVWADAPEERFQTAGNRLVSQLRREGKPLRVLALSAGADKGAYGAGFLYGWSKTGTRPQFNAVTGVSTGSLIAPYAFLGPDYDEPLKAIFTQIDARDVFSVRGIVGIFGSGLASNAPLRRMINEHVTPELLEAIAQEHQKGRILLVATTDLDAQRGVIWNMGRIAEVGTPRALEVFREVLVASASIPALFPPALIPVEAGSLRYDELHVDGGAINEVFTLPDRVLLSRGIQRALPGGEFTIIINDTFEPDFEVVKAGTIPIAARSLATLAKSNTQRTVAQTYDFTQDRKFDFQLTFIGEDFDKPYPGPFNRAYMNTLFDYGVERGKAGAFFDEPPVLTDRISGPRS
ncbi:MAG: patatin-like phospholipase family protein [Pseudomonadota bacterium]